VTLGAGCTDSSIAKETSAAAAPASTTFRMSGALSCFRIVVCGDQGTDHRLPPRPPARGAFLAALEPAFLDSAAFSAALAALDFFMRSFTSLR